MEESGIKGKRREPCLPLAQRLQLHCKVLRLREQGLSYNKIIEEVNRFSGVRLCWWTIYYWVQRIKEPVGRVNEVDTRPSPALAYIIGVKFGDGYVYSNSKEQIFTFELRVTDYEFAAWTGRCLTKLLGQKEPYIPRWDKWNHRWHVRCYSILLYEFLRQPLERLRPYIEHCKDCLAAFLKGFFDSEGSITGRILKATNTNRELLLYVKELFQRYFGIETTRPRMSVKAGQCFHDPRTGKIYKSKKQCNYLYMRANSLPLFHKHIGFTIRRKQRRLVEAIRE